jgi:erythronate-4-phosphate dehydrogenase
MNIYQEPSSIRLVADRNIPGIEENRHLFAKVTLLDGRNICKQDLINCDALLVRSVTQVNHQLLKDTPVKFVGSATSGIDHVNLSHLKQLEIAFAYATGSNALSVAQYVLCAIAAMHLHKQESWPEHLGIIGFGPIGQAVYKTLKPFVKTIVAYDPFIDPLTFPEVLRPLRELALCDTVSFHVPLTYDGNYPTYSMVNEAYLSLLKPGVRLINAARGEIICTKSVIKALDNGFIRTAIMDVFPNEPHPEALLLNKCFLHTPHIAGHSKLAKITGGVQILRALLAHFQVSDSQLVVPPSPIIEISVNPSQGLAGALLQSYDIRVDHKEMLSHRILNPEGYFDHLRKSYPFRPEFSQVKVLNFSALPLELKAQLKALGFK